MKADCSVLASPLIERTANVMHEKSKTLSTGFCMSQLKACEIMAEIVGSFLKRKPNRTDTAVIIIKWYRNQRWNVRWGMKVIKEENLAKASAKGDSFPAKVDDE